MDDNYVWNKLKFVRTKDFCQYYVYEELKPDTLLKVDFVNDIAAHFGGFTSTDLFYKTDSIRNILSNKVSALFRLAAKDVVDLLYLSYTNNFHWTDLIDEAREKDSGIDATVVSEVLESFPKIKLDEISWITKPNYDQLMEGIKKISIDCLEVKSNSLCKNI